MKITHVIILLFLVVKTSFGMDLIGLVSSDCCSDKVELCDTDGTPISDDSGCCDGPDCDCMCCGHVFLDFGSSQKSISQLPAQIHISAFTYVSSTSLQAPDAIWHPPKIF